MFFRFLIVPIVMLIIVGLLLFGIIHNLIRLLRNKGKLRNVIGLAIPIIIIGAIVYGFTLGFEKFKVQQVTFESEDLPEAFDGYKIVMFSDAHVGNFKSRPQILKRAVDSINAQHADAVVFCGDIENLAATELEPFVDVFSSISARDGVFSVLGNHDMSLYMHDADEKQREQMLQRTIKTEESFGWRMLLNANAVVRRGNDSIFIAGEENDGCKPFPSKADVVKTMEGISEKDFVVMLQHDPTAWRRQILPSTNAQLTLSGHTHAGQISIFGLSPTQFMYKENKGAYYEGARMLYVSSGLGGVVPFRFGVPGEIVVITLKSKNTDCK